MLKKYVVTKGARRGWNEKYMTDSLAKSTMIENPPVDRGKILQTATNCVRPSSKQMTNKTVQPLQAHISN
jgi:hypothetical protein